jgi:hypothetical protein
LIDLEAATCTWDRAHIGRAAACGASPLWDRRRPMTSVLKTVLFAGTAVLAIQLGALAAQAGDLDDLLAAQQYADALDDATGGDNLVTNIIKDDDSEEVIDTLKNLIEEVAE